VPAAKSTAPERKEAGHALGVHRVRDTEPRLPQAAQTLDASLPIYPNEILIRVERLNIDAASFVQMEEETGKNPDRIGQIVTENCRTRGKQQNRVTGSGGMLIGTIAQIGSRYRGPVKIKTGERVATLVSLTLTPLHLERIHRIHFQTHQIEVEGHAILFESSILASLPKDIAEPVAMSVFDVAGAPATVNALCTAGKTLVVIGGGGKAGILSCVAGRRKVGKAGKVFAIEPHPGAAADLRALGVCNEVLEINAKDPIAVHSSVQRITRGKMGDVVVNVAPVPDTEVASILSAKARGTVLFFSMATSFTKVALGAEGVASDARLLFGNGYYPGHGKFSLDLLRKHKGLRELFYRRYNP
jgi:L-erythro-3,5-diaminohexanoate dehydrogenase